MGDLLPLAPEIDEPHILPVSSRISQFMEVLCYTWRCMNQLYLISVAILMIFAATSVVVPQENGSNNQQSKKTRLVKSSSEITDALVLVGELAGNNFTLKGTGFFINSDGAL